MKNSICKNIILFGAGASNGLVNIIPNSPPMGSNLYPQLQTNFPRSWGNIPSQIDNYFQSHFELGMEAIWDNNSTVVPQLMREIAFYFLEFRPDPSKENLYSQFVEKLPIKETKSNFIFSSLNYELLLELALNSKGYQIEYFGEKSGENLIPVWKLHGSANFIPNTIQATREVSFTKGVSFEAGVRYENPGAAAAFCQSNTALYPSMCLYMNSKPTQISHNFLRQQQARWQKLVLGANKVLIVGIKPYLADTHIWASLTQTKAKVGFVGSNNAYNDWINSGRDDKNTEFIGNRWNHVFDESVKFFI